MIDEQIEELRNDFYEVSSYAEWCEDDKDSNGDCEYCETFIDALHEIFDEIVGLFEQYFDMEGQSALSILKKAAEVGDITDYGHFYQHVKSINLERRYHTLLGTDDCDFEELGDSFDKMIDDFYSVYWDEED